MLALAAIAAAAPAAQRGGLALLILLDVEAGSGNSLLKEHTSSPPQPPEFAIDDRHHLADRHLPAARAAGHPDAATWSACSKSTASNMSTSL